MKVVVQYVAGRDVYGITLVFDVFPLIILILIQYLDISGLENITFDLIAINQGCGILRGTCQRRLQLGRLLKYALSYKHALILGLSSIEEKRVLIRNPCEYNGLE